MPSYSPIVSFNAERFTDWRLRVRPQLYDQGWFWRLASMQGNLSLIDLLAQYAGAVLIERQPL